MISSDSNLRDPIPRYGRQHAGRKSWRYEEILPVLLEDRANIVPHSEGSFQCRVRVNRQEISVLPKAAS